MPQYIANVQATSNGTINTDDKFIEITAPASTIFKVKRLRVCWGDGTQTAGVDNLFRIKVVRTSTAGATGSTFTPIRKDVNSPAAVATVKVKNGTNAFSTGTITDTVDQISANGRMIYEWIARDDQDMIVVLPAGIFGIIVSSGVISQLFTVTAEWLE